jgi:rhamnopyranosyl-N-acetylglucosaminyl-diphospho-decaprenol beta-1,3/1,4-galactofuranosyltransferase
VTFAAVVVSYNRRDLLEKCLTALENQTRPLDEIIVVDNGSTDGSAEYVAENHPDVFLFRTGANLGGAGGFAWGVEIALAHGHEGAWLMDDDAEPELDAVAPLIEAFENVHPTPSFVASLVTAGRGTYNKRNPPVISNDAERQVVAHAHGGIAIDTATFVGVMVNLRLAATTHLPLSDFFIWLDDSEYTHRLSRRELAMVMPSSMINHPDNKPVSNDMAGRLFYFLRNYLWYIRERDGKLSSDMLDRVGLVIHAARQFAVASDKKLWATSVAKGFGQGLFTRPRRQLPGSLLETLPAGERARLTTGGAQE